MIYKHDISNVFDNVIGFDGVSEQEFTSLLLKAKRAIIGIGEQREKKLLPFLDITDYENDVVQIEKTAKHINDNFSDLVIVGMGASARGGKTLVALARNSFTGISNSTKIHFIDNIDPLTFDNMRATLDLKSTIFLVISKSGSTAETMAQLLVLLNDVASKIGQENINNHFIFITESNDNSLTKIAYDNAIKIFEHNHNIGGRFSVLTAVGLLPAAVAGLDIRAIRDGATEIINLFFSDEEPEPAKGAVIHEGLLQKGKNISVMMPYSDRLNAFSSWHQQLWAESLGKSGNGTTALRALGAFDQHSQLQLYLDGPADKFITLITLNQKNKGAVIPLSDDDSLAYLAHHAIGDLMAAEQLATKNTLIKNRRPVREFAIEKIDEHTIGALLMHFMLETMVMGRLWNVDTFGQPAVEQGKQLAREYLANSKSNLNFG